VGQCPGQHVSVGACYEVLCQRPYSGPEIQCTHLLLPQAPDSRSVLQTVRHQQLNDPSQIPIAVQKLGNVPQGVQRGRPGHVLQALYSRLRVMTQGDSLLGQMTGNI